MKLHLVLDHDGYLLCFGVITDGSVHDVKVAHQLTFSPDTIVVDDRGYNDYRLFATWTDAKVFFVTRLKDNAQFDVVAEREPPTHRGILKDQTIRLTGSGAPEKCPHVLRRIEAIREDTGNILVLLTNHHGLGASTIAAIYKDRWQIELFFKALKQNLKIKTFVGTSVNTVKIQIWTALMAMPLLRYLQLTSRFGWSLTNLVALLRMNLFTHRDLMAWLDEPFETPPEPQMFPQARLAFRGSWTAGGGTMWKSVHNPSETLIRTGPLDRVSAVLDSSAPLQFTRQYLKNEIPVFTYELVISSFFNNTKNF